MAKVLIVDDDRVARRVCATVAESRGHVAIQVSQGVTALQVLKDNPDISMVITDYHMPEMDGRKLAMFIHADPTLRGIPVIMVSGVVREPEIRDLLGVGVSRFIEKPVDVRELSKHIDRLLGPQAHLVAV